MYSLLSAPLNILYYQAFAELLELHKYRIFLWVLKRKWLLAPAKQIILTTMIPYKQLSVINIFTDCQNQFKNDNPTILLSTQKRISLDLECIQNFYMLSMVLLKFLIHLKSPNLNRIFSKIYNLFSKNLLTLLSLSVRLLIHLKLIWLSFTLFLSSLFYPHRNISRYPINTKPS